MPAVKPKCPKCEHEVFELSEIDVKRSSTKLNAVICSNCGSIIAVSDQFVIKSDKPAGYAVRV